MHRHRHVWTTSPKSMTPPHPPPVSGKSMPGQKAVVPLHQGRANSSSLNLLGPRAQLACARPSQSQPAQGESHPQHMNHLQAGLSRSQLAKGGCSQGKGMWALAPSFSHPQKGSWGGGGASRCSPRPRCSLWLFIPM